MMKNINVEKITEHFNIIFIATIVVGFSCLFFIQMMFVLSLSMWSYITWGALCFAVYLFSHYLKNKNSSEFDFYEVAEPLGRQERRKKQNIEERVAFHIAEDGLDPMVLFDEQKSGVVCILKITDLDLDNRFLDYLAEFEISAELQGHPIAGQTLMVISYQGDNAYYRLTVDTEVAKLEFAFPEKTGVLYDQLCRVIRALLLQHPQAMIKKIDVSNLQAMIKFYHYVQRLSAPENRSVDYLSYHQGTLKICNSSYVALYDCTLQSTLTSWINHDGLIRTDNVDVDLGEKSALQLMDIELPYATCRLTDIQIVKRVDLSNAMKLFIEFSELDEGTLTGQVSSLSLLMKDNSISIKRDEQFEDELISVACYFEQKSYPLF